MELLDFQVYSKGILNLTISFLNLLKRYPFYSKTFPMFLLKIPILQELDLQMQNVALTTKTLNEKELEWSFIYLIRYNIKEEKFELENDTIGKFESFLRWLGIMDHNHHLIFENNEDNSITFKT